MMLFFFLPLLLGINDAVALKRECPPAGSLKCSCEKRYGPSFTCAKVTLEDLVSDLPELKEYAIDTLTLKDITYERATEDMFEGLHINHLLLDNTVTEKDSFKEGLVFFRGLEKSLTVLEIRNCYHRGGQLNYFRLDHLQNLKALRMQDNKIVKVGNDWFATGPKTLFAVVLENNKITTFGDKVFQALDNLQILRVKGNFLRDLSRSMLPSSATKLQKIDLSSNRLSDIPKDLFTNMPALEAVRLQNNNLKAIAEGTFSASVYVHLEGNPLQCDADLKWLCSAKVDHHMSRCDTPEDKQGLVLKLFCNA